MADTGPLDPHALQAMLKMVVGDTALLAELIDTHLDDSVELLAALERALADGDARLLKRSTHSLKSNSQGCVALALATLARQLEHLGAGGRSNDATGLLAEAQVEFMRVQTALLATRRGADA